MPTTPTYALPYPAGGDDIRLGNDVIQALAERVEALLSVQTTGRNVIRNGDMGVAQRGNGTFASGSTIDGFKWYIGGAATGLVSRAEFNAANPTVRYDLIAQSVTAPSAAGDYLFLGIPIEDVRTLSGRVCTLSMRAVSSVAGRVIGVAIRQSFGTGGSAVQDTAIGNFPLVPSTTPIDSAAALVTLTFTMPSITTKTIGTADDHYVELRLWLGSGSGTLGISGFSSAAQGTQGAFNFTCTQIQLEAGDKATPFERLPQQQQLAWCQRYYYRLHNTSASNLYLGVGNPWAATALYVPITLPVQMRTTPVYGASAALGFLHQANGTVTGSSLTGMQYNIVTLTTTGTFTVGYPTLLYVPPGVYIQFNAEL